jgi:outer membrane protein OmpA-like peptidoglycan-associated protein
MKKIFLLLLLINTLLATGQTDKAGCDTIEPHYLNRIPGFIISDCAYSEFGSYNFGANLNGQYNSLKKEGVYMDITYRKNPSETRKFSKSQVFKNYSDAFLKIKGKILADDKSVMTATINGHEVFIHVNAFPDAENVDNYYVRIIEVAKMKQDIVVDLQEAMERDGKALLYGILFDVGKSEIKPESVEALKQIADYLNTNQSSKVIVVGHTDNSGTYTNNMTLSKARAESIKTYLITKNKIASTRLLSEGVGQVCPVANNGTEEGRKLNRRVEIVKQ